MSPWAPVLLPSLLALTVTPAGERLQVRDGEALVASFAPRTPAARRGSATARAVAVAGHPLIEVRVPSTTGATEEVWLGEVRAPGSAAAPLWTGVVGPLDDDGETARALVVGPDEVELFDTATRVGRCDGTPARLFGQRWDFARRRWKAMPPPLPPAAEQTIKARAGDPAMPSARPSGGFYWTAASSTAGVTAVGGLAPPVPLNDGDPRTAWVSAAGDPAGAFLTARTAAEGIPVVGLRLVLPAGDRRGAGRPRRLAILLGPGADRRFDVELPEGARGGDPLWAPLPRPVVTSCVTVVVREGGPGPVAIADLEVVTDLDRPDGIERLARAAREGTGCEGRVPLLVQAGAAAVEPVAAAIAAGPAAGRECLLDALEGLLDADPALGRRPAVAAALVAGLDRASEGEEKRILAALPRLADPPVAALAAALADEHRPEAERIRAARALAALWGTDGSRPPAEPEGERPPRAGSAPTGRPARVASGPSHPSHSTKGRLAATDGLPGAATSVASGPSHPSHPTKGRLAGTDAAPGGAAPSSSDGGAEAAKRALLAAVGRGAPAVRAAVRERLSAAPPPLAAQARAALAATPAEAAERRADLIVVAGVVAGREPAEQAATLEVLRAAAGGPPFLVQARALEALGRLAGEPALAELARVRASSADPVVRYLAVRELAGVPSPLALAPLRAALDDGDPRVRETAATALGDRGDNNDALALVAAAKREPWPFARRAQVTALGALCAPGTTDLLIRADERDLPEVRRAALEGLARCKDPRAPRLLLTRLGRRAEDPDLRAVAARLLGGMADRQLAPKLAEILARLRIESQDDAALEGVTVVALQALARLGGPDAVRGARGLLEDERPGLRRAALEALGTLCDGDAGARAVETATRDPDPTVAAAAAAARRHCRQAP